MKCILLHGLGQTPSDWNDTVKNLDENFEETQQKLSTLAKMPSH